MANTQPEQRPAPDGSDLATEFQDSFQEAFQEAEEALTRLGASILQIQQNDPPEEERLAMIDDLEERFHDLRQRFEDLEAAEHARAAAEAAAESETAKGDSAAVAPASDAAALARERLGQFRASADETLQSARQRVDQAYKDLRTIVATRRSANAAKGAQLSVGERFDRAWKDVSDRLERGRRRKPGSGDGGGDRQHGRKPGHGDTLGSGSETTEKK